MRTAFVLLALALCLASAAAMRAVSRSSIVAAADADIDVAVTTGTDSESHDSHDQTSSSSVDSLSTQAASARTTGTDVSGAGHLKGSGKYYRPTPRWPGGHINPRDDTARCTITLDNEFEFVQQVEDYNNSGQFYKQFKVYAGKKVFVRERRGSRLGNICTLYWKYRSTVRRYPNGQSTYDSVVQGSTITGDQSQPTPYSYKCNLQCPY